MACTSRVCLTAKAPHDICCRQLKTSQLTANLPRKISTEEMRFEVFRQFRNTSDVEAEYRGDLVNT